MAKQNFDSAMTVPSPRGGASVPPGAGQRTRVAPRPPRQPDAYMPDGSEEETSGVSNSESNPSGYGLAPGQGRRLGPDDPMSLGRYYPNQSGTFQSGRDRATGGARGR